MDDFCPYVKLDLCSNDCISCLHSFFCCSWLQKHFCEPWHCLKDPSLITYDMRISRCRCMAFKGVEL